MNSQQNSAQKNYTDQFNGTGETSKVLNQINNTLLGQNLFASAQKNSTAKQHPTRYSISDSPAAILNNASQVLMSGVIPNGHNKHQSLLSPGGAMQLNRENSMNNGGPTERQNQNNPNNDGINNMIRNHNDSLNSSFDSRRPHYPPQSQPESRQHSYGG